MPVFPGRTAGYSPPWKSDLDGHLSTPHQRFPGEPGTGTAGSVRAVLPLSAGRPDFHAEGSDPKTPPGAVSMFYVVTYAGSGLVTVGVGLLATLFGLTVSVRWFAAVLAAACLLTLAALPRQARSVTTLLVRGTHVSQLARDLEVSLPVLHVHLAKLQEAGLVTSSLRFSDDGKSLRHFELAAIRYPADPRDNRRFHRSFNRLAACPGRISVMLGTIFASPWQFVLGFRHATDYISL